MDDRIFVRCHQSALRGIITDVIIFSRPGPRAVGISLLLLAMYAALAVPAQALECPAPKALTRPGVLRETPAQITAMSNLLATGDVSNRVSVVVADLRARYPGVENAELVNYLMAAYCPIVARLSGLSEAEKQARMDNFVSQVAQLVYSAGDPARPAKKPSLMAVGPFSHDSRREP
jgi:hypothetical protein